MKNDFPSFNTFMKKYGTPDLMRCEGEGCKFCTPSLFMMEEHEEVCENLLLFGVAHGDFISWVDGQVFE